MDTTPSAQDYTEASRMCPRVMGEYCRQIADLRAVLAQAKAAMKNADDYLDHAPICRRDPRSGTATCDCGLDQAQAQLTAAIEAASKV
jgi:hypothetical protein